MIKIGAQVNAEGIEERIMNADLIAATIDNDIILTTAALKNPVASYRNKIFELSGSLTEKDHFDKELGYIVTNNKYEHQKLCQKLLLEFFPIIKMYTIFATIRKPSMAHIFKKYGFDKIGKTYKEDLGLFVYYGGK